MGKGSPLHQPGGRDAKAQGRGDRDQREESGVEKRPISKRIAKEGSIGLQAMNDPAFSLGAKAHPDEDEEEDHYGERGDEADSDKERSLVERRPS